MDSSEVRVEQRGHHVVRFVVHEHAQRAPVHSRVARLVHQLSQTAGRTHLFGGLNGQGIAGGTLCDLPPPHPGFYTHTRDNSRHRFVS